MSVQLINAKVGSPSWPPVMAGRQFRPARLSDMPRLKNLIDAAVRHLGGRDYSRQQIESSLQYIFGADTPQLIADGTYYVVEIDGQLAGAGGWSKRKTLYGGDQAKAETEDNRLDPSRDAAKIRAFYVDPHRARQGIGRQLLRVCETAARQAGFTRLELMATLTGMPLYAACGFRVVAPAEIEMPDGIRLPVAKMEKIITSP